MVDHTTSDRDVARERLGTDDTSAVGLAVCGTASELGGRTVGGSNTRGEASAVETETTLVGSRDTEVLATSSVLVGVLAMLAGGDEALHHHLTKESLHAV